MNARSWRVGLVAVALVLAACTQSTTRTASNSPQASPTESASAAGSPSGSSTTPGASASPSSSQSPSAAGAALAIGSLSFHAGEVGISYAAVALTANGGTPPYTWSLMSGSLPAGLSLSSHGVVSGTPASAGTPTFTVGVSDSAGGSASALGKIPIYPRLAVSAPCADPASACAVEEGCKVCGVFGSVSGGQSPYRFTVTVDNRPPGMGISGLSLTGAFPSPGPLGQYNVTVVVTDQQGMHGTVAGNWYIFPHITFGGGKISCFYTGCSVSFPYTGGTPGGPVSAAIRLVSYSQTCPAGPPNCPPPPDSFSIKAAPGPGGGTVTITVTLVGNPAWQSNGWSGTLQVVLTDSSPCGPGNCNTGAVNVTITVQAG